jgi:hypothetical protein
MSMLLRLASSWPGPSRLFGRPNSGEVYSPGKTLGNGTGGGETNKLPSLGSADGLEGDWI